MSLHTKNYKIRLNNLKTRFNRESKNRNIELNKHNIVFSGIIFGMVGITILAGFILFRPKNSLTASAATDSALASVTVPDVCTMSSSSTNHTATVNGGSYATNVGGESTVSVVCNDRNGYSVYAVGYGNDTLGNTNLTGSSTNLTIPTGTSTDASVSNWAMKLTAVTGTYTPTILSDANGSFANYHVVPSNATKVVTYPNDINVSTSSQFKASYAVAIASNQAVDTYVGKVKYTVVHPNYANADGSTIYPVTLTLGANTSSITIDGTTYSTSGASPSLSYGTHTISATFPSGYELDSWSATGGVVISGPTSASTTITVTGSGTLTVTGEKADPCKGHETELYCKVKALWTQGGSRVQTNDTDTTTGIQAAITTANSGVFQYNSSVFGTASDAANTSDIYYYRGILDQTMGSYGSDGDGKAWPNYVILDANGTKETTDTCWRIVRTTGSGGVKMIYNGKWTGSTCANATTNAQVTTQAFGLKGNSAQSDWYRNINRVGYTFNNTQSLQDSTTATDVNTVFGSDSSPSTNNARSNIKTYIEDTWYASNMTAWTSKLEASAGYCNDRTAFSNDTGATALTTTPPYATSSAGMYFGAYTRNLNSAKTPSLTCPRSTVDLYRYVSGSTGVSNELKYPVALITADEASFAGSGSSTATNGSSYNANSYLRSGSNFWLLSPYLRSSNGRAYGLYLRSGGYLDSSDGGYVNTTYGVRPVISLVSGTTPTGGTGTATDPWIVTP